MADFYDVDVQAAVERLTGTHADQLDRCDRLAERLREDLAAERARSAALLAENRVLWRIHALLSAVAGEAFCALRAVDLTATQGSAVGVRALAVKTLSSMQGDWDTVQELLGDMAPLSPTGD